MELDLASIAHGHLPSRCFLVCRFQATFAEGGHILVALSPRMGIDTKVPLRRVIGICRLERRM